MKKFATLILFGLLMVAHGEADAQSLCGGKVKAVRRGSLPQEVSGSSSLFWMDGRLWTANDHGALRLYALDTLTAEIDSVIDLGAKVYDLEEVTLDSLYLYFGDFGDNNGTRSSLRILRLSRHDLAEGRFLFDTIFFHYPERTVDNARDFDCEAFLAGTDSLQEAESSGGLGDSGTLEDSGVDNQRNLRDVVDLVAAGHEQGNGSGGSHGRNDGISPISHCQSRNFSTISDS